MEWMDFAVAKSMEGKGRKNNIFNLTPFQNIRCHFANKWQMIKPNQTTNPKTKSKEHRNPIYLLSESFKCLKWTITPQPIRKSNRRKFLGCDKKNNLTFAPSEFCFLKFFLYICTK